MPRYDYKCQECGVLEDLILKASVSRYELLKCGSCGNIALKRLVSRPSSPHGFKVFAGDWFEKEHGRDIAQGAVDRIEAAKQYERDKAKCEQEGVRFTHKSRQVGGNDRISIRDDS